MRKGNHRPHEVFNKRSTELIKGHDICLGDLSGLSGTSGWRLRRAKSLFRPGLFVRSAHLSSRRSFTVGVADVFIILGSVGK